MGVEEVDAVELLPSLTVRYPYSVVEPNVVVLVVDPLDIVETRARVDIADDAVVSVRVEAYEIYLPVGVRNSELVTGRVSLEPELEDC